jgi:hypothetical protein
MKMYRIKKQFLATLIIFIILFDSSLADKNWCWTKSMVNEPSYVFDAANGGVNWGYCKDTSVEDKIIKYEIEVFTSIIDGSETR